MLFHATRRNRGKQLQTQNMSTLSGARLKRCKSNIWVNFEFQMKFKVLVMENMGEIMQKHGYSPCPSNIRKLSYRSVWVYGRQVSNKFINALMHHSIIPDFPLAGGIGVDDDTQTLLALLTLVRAPAK
jgi:hypothetical protein